VDTLTQQPLLPLHQLANFMEESACIYRSTNGWLDIGSFFVFIAYFEPIQLQSLLLNDTRLMAFGSKHSTAGIFATYPPSYTNASAALGNEVYTSKKYPFS